jgi:hypothetical protein
MAGHGSKPGERRGGRKKGTPNKATVAKAAAVAASGVTPLDFMLSVLRDETKELSMRMEASKAAAPYVHARLAQIEHSGPDGGPLQIQVVKFADSSHSG